jgi:hypothetical protein
MFGATSDYRNREIILRPAHSANFADLRGFRAYLIMQLRPHQSEFMTHYSRCHARALALLTSPLMM